MGFHRIDLADQLIHDALGEVFGVTDVMLSDVGIAGESAQFVLKSADHGQVIEVAISAASRFALLAMRQVRAVGVFVGDGEQQLDHDRIGAAGMQLPSDLAG